MCNRTLAVAACFLAFCGCAPADDTQPLTVLFIGNSYTFVNDLPGMLTELARAGGGKIETGLDAPGGYTLQEHVKDGKAAAAIRSKKWDFVVLQEQSQVPFMAPAMMADNAAKLDALVCQDHAQTLFYLTWARKSQRQNQAAITHSYFTSAENLHAAVAPVGVAWARANKAQPSLNLYSDDGSHPSPAGTYLAACVFYAKLLGKSPEGLPANVTHDGQVLAALSSDDAKLLQTTAWQTVQEVKSEREAE